MRFQGLDLNLLVALDALLTEINVSVAAERVHLSQSAMSGALNRLREYFNDDLLVIRGRKMMLTSRAESLMLPVRDALLQIKTTITTPPEFEARTATRHFRVLASDFARQAVIAETLRRLSTEAPHISFTVAPIYDDPIGQLVQGSIDVLITLEQYTDQEHPSTLLFEDDFVLVAWVDGDVVKQPMSASRYFELPHVLVQFGRAHHPSYDETFMRAQGWTRRAEVIVPDFSDLPNFVVGTNRIATMQRRLATHFARIMPLAVLPLPFAMPFVREMAHWHRHQDSDPGMRWFIERLRTVAQDGDGI